MVINIEAPAITVDLDGEDFLKRVGRPLARELRRRMMSGLTPSGNPAPAVSEATLKRREYREKQAQRGGRVADRYDNPEQDFPDSAMQLRKRQYNGRVRGNINGWHVRGKNMPSGRFGLETGLLARSVAFGKDRVSGKYCIFFANNRAIIGKDGSSAAKRVFQRPGMQLGPGIFTSAAMQPIIKRATRALFARQARRLGKELRRTAESLIRLQRSFAQEFESRP
jgi:hypothetical protein